MLNRLFKKDFYQVIYITVIVISIYMFSKTVIGFRENMFGGLEDKAYILPSMNLDVAGIHSNQVSDTLQEIMTQNDQSQANDSATVSSIQQST
jgi:hypothetical protein